LIYFS
jgi:hypothetical protein